MAGATKGTRTADQWIYANPAVGSLSTGLAVVGVVFVGRLIMGGGLFHDLIAAVVVGLVVGLSTFLAGWWRRSRRAAAAAGRAKLPH